MVEIRPEGPADIAAIRAVHHQAFGQHQEGGIVDALRNNGGALLSLVAVQDGRVAGHILFSPLRVGSVTGAALGPMAVVPEAQRLGIGTKLVQAGIEMLTHNGCPLVVVLGHPTFYPRFGFRPARRYGITCQWPVPDPVFMVLPLDDARMAQAVGVAVYRPEFGVADSPRQPEGTR